MPSTGVRRHWAALEFLVASEPRFDGSKLDPPIEDPLPVLRVLVASYFVMLFIGLGVAALRGVVPSKLWGADPWEDMLLGTLAALFLILASWLMAILVRPLREMIGELRAVFSPLSPLRLCLLSLLISCAEEVLFRGVLQPTIGYVAASLLFGAIHIVPNLRLAPWTLFAIGAGFILGYLYKFTGGLLAPILAHLIVNATNLILITRQPWHRGHRRA
jgi:membrane protease YdiL (CAAX protease family)